jgi:hypothetical protein
MFYGKYFVPKVYLYINIFLIIFVIHFFSLFNYNEMTYLIQNFSMKNSFKFVKNHFGFGDFSPT